MNYLNMGAAPAPGTPPNGANGNMYGDDPSLSIPNTQPGEDYRTQATANQMQQGNIFDGQVQRVPRGNQLVRMPSYSGMPGAGMPTSMSAGVNMSMNMMGSSGMMQQPVPYGAQMQDGMDRKLNNEIEKMKKKRTSIPPFVLKLSRYGRSLWLPRGCFANLCCC